MERFKSKSMRRQAHFDHENLSNKQKLYDYIDRHGVTSDLVSKQCIHAFTRSDDPGTLIAVEKYMEARETVFESYTKAASKHRETMLAEQSQPNYSPSNQIAPLPGLQQFKSSYTKINYFVEEYGYLFHEYKIKDPYLVSNRKKYWDSKYNQFVFSQDQTLLIMIEEGAKKKKHKESKQSQSESDLGSASGSEYSSLGEQLSSFASQAPEKTNIIRFDLYDFSDNDFMYLDENTPKDDYIDHDNEGYRDYFDLELPDYFEGKEMNFSYEFSNDNQYLIVKGDDYLALVPIPGENQKSKKYYELSLSKNYSYNKIKTVYVNTENIQDSLVVLRADSLNMIHVVTLQACLAHETLAIKSTSNIPQPQLNSRKSVDHTNVTGNLLAVPALGNLKRFSNDLSPKRKSVEAANLGDVFKTVASTQKISKQIKENLFKKQCIGADTVKAIAGKSIVINVALTDNKKKPLDLSCEFSKDGQLLCISTETESYYIRTDLKKMQENSKAEQPARKFEITHHKNQNAPYQPFKKDDDNFFVLCYNENDDDIQIKTAKTQDNPIVLESSIDAYQQELQIISCKEDKQSQILRVIYIINSQDLCLKDLKLEKFYKEKDKLSMKKLSSKARSQIISEENFEVHIRQSQENAFKWPQFAYTFDEYLLMQDLNNRKLTYYLNLALQKEEHRIIGMQYANDDSYDLFVLQESRDTFRIDQLNLLNKTRIVQQFRKAQSSDGLSQIDQWFINIDNEKQVHFYCKSKDKLFKIEFLNDGKINKKRIIDDIDGDIQFFSNQQLAFKMKYQENKILLLDLSIPETVKAPIVIKQTKTQQIIAFRTSECTEYVKSAQQHLKPYYVLTKSSQNYFLKIYHWDEENLSSMLYSKVHIGQEHQFVIKLFQEAEFVMEDLLLMKEDLVQIKSHCMNGKTKSYFETFEQFLPHFQSDNKELNHKKMQLLIKDTKLCVQHRRLALFLNRSNSKTVPKQAVFLPFFGDNSIQLNQNEKVMTWFESRKTETYVMQFSLKDSTLRQYDLKGLCVQETDKMNFGEADHGNSITLACMPQRPQELSTSKGDYYLREFTFRKVKVTKTDRESLVLCTILQTEDSGLSVFNHYIKPKTYKLDQIYYFEDFETSFESQKSINNQMTAGLSMVDQLSNIGPDELEKITGKVQLSPEIEQRIQVVFCEIGGGKEVRVEKALEHFVTEFDKNFAKKLFKVIDVDKNGIISKSEFQILWKVAKSCGHDDKTILEELENMKSKHLTNNDLYSKLSKLKKDNRNSSFDFCCNNNKDILLTMKVDERITNIIFISCKKKRAHKVWFQDQIYEDWLKQLKENDDESYLEYCKEIPNISLNQFYLDCKYCLLTDNQIIVYSARQIFYYNLKDQENSKTLRLSKSKFEMEIKDDDTFIDKIYSGNPEDDAVVVRILSSIDSLHESCTYSVCLLAENIEKYSYESKTKDSRLFFDVDRYPFVIDHGNIINIETKQIMLQYHLEDQLILFKNTHLSPDWHFRLSKLSRNQSKFFVLACKIILPYTYLSYLHHCSAKDINSFDVDQFYKVDGTTIFHKYKGRLDVCERILDSFYQQDKLYCTAVLVKTDEQLLDRRWKILSMIKEQEEDPNCKGKFFDSYLEKRIDVLINAIKISSDSFVNKLMLYLSNLPIMLSYHQLKPYYADFMQISPKGALLYLDKWFQQTTEMKETKILTTRLNQNELYLRSLQTSLLDQEFYKKFESHLESQKELFQEIKMMQSMSTSRGSADNNFKPIQKQPSTSKKDDAKTKNSALFPIECMYLEAMWLFNPKSYNKEYGKAFWQALTEQDIETFKSPTIEKLINYRWQTIQPILIHKLMQFSFLGYVPYCYLAIGTGDLYMKDASDFPDFSTFNLITFTICILLQIIFSFKETKYIIREAIDHEVTGAFFSPFWYTRILLIIVIIWSCIKLSIFFYHSEDDDFHPSSDYNTQNLAILQIVGILLYTIIIFHTLRIFPLFAYFYRQFIEICKHSSALAFALLLVIFTLTMCFNLMINNEETRFANTFINSYRLTLGDFEISSEDTINSTFFWILFLIGTIVSMLILLNMVIAVMSEAFQTIQDNKDAYLLKEKLLICEEEHFSFKNQIKSIDETIYLISFEVDPVQELEINSDADHAEVGQLTQSSTQLQANDFLSQSRKNPYKKQLTLESLKEDFDEKFAELDKKVDHRFEELMDFLQRDRGAPFEPRKSVRYT